MDYDVVIIGAGPVGGYLARRFVEHGHTVLLVEEHSEIGRPFQCAGMVNPSAMELVNLEHTVLDRIWGANIHSPSGTTVSIGDPAKTRTFAVCRKLFDEAVVLQSIDAGADIMLEAKPIHVEDIDGGLIVDIESSGSTHRISTKLLCGADGAHSWVRRKFRMGRPRENMIGFQIEVTGYPQEEGMLEMFTGKEIAPGFFSWAIPCGEVTRIGTWTKSSLLDKLSCEDLLNNLMNHEIWGGKFENCNEVGRFCGPVPSGMVRKPLIEKVALFGDAAGICKPTTGGGIGPGFKQVDILVPYLSKAINYGDLRKRSMEKISKKLNEMRRSQRRKRALRDAFVTEVTDEELDDVFSVWVKPEVISLINELGDIENPVPLGIRMLRDVPEFRNLAGKAAKALLWG